MLRLPERGIRRSIQSHNSDFFALCDWVEASALTTDDELTRGDVLDNLITEQIYDDQDFCAEQLADVWNELARRHKWLSDDSPIQTRGHKLLSDVDWREWPALAFCLHVSLAPLYSGYYRHFGSDYTDQGELFELLTMEFSSTAFPLWKSFRSGWSASHTVKLEQVVPQFADTIRQDVAALEKYGNRQANESGLDLAWYRPFHDGRGGYPIYLVQCASGRGWPNKLHTPELAVWTKLIDFTHPPSKAFSCPFALLDDEFARRTNQVQGLLLDRYRLLSPGAPEPQWVSRELRDRLVEWLEPRVAWTIED